MPVTPMRAMTTCEGCGSCCYDWDVPVEEDEARVVGVELVESDDIYFAHMKRDPATRACVAFDTDIGRCTIYERRPRVCRDFELGGYDCFRKAAARGKAPLGGVSDETEWMT